MLKRASDNQDQRSLASRFRRNRFAFFQSLLSRLNHPIRILDVGGTERYWRMMEPNANVDVSITLLNLTRQTISLPNITSRVGDARRIDAQDASFDVVFSNSVIEHVPAYQDQIQMAKEIRRVGKRYFVQTPNRYFPVEPHFLFPFFQFMPIAIRVWLLQNFDLGWIGKSPDAARAREIVTGIRLLSKREFMTCFPGADIYDEKILGITKSFIAYNGWNE